MKKKLIILLLFILLCFVPTTKVLANEGDLIYDIESLRVEEGNLVFEGWAFIHKYDNCSPAISLTAYEGDNYIATAALERKQRNFYAWMKEDAAKENYLYYNVGFKAKFNLSDFDEKSDISFKITISNNIQTDENLTDVSQCNSTLDSSSKFKTGKSKYVKTTEEADGKPGKSISDSKTKAIGVYSNSVEASAREIGVTGMKDYINVTATHSHVQESANYSRKDYYWWGNETRYKLVDNKYYSATENKPKEYFAYIDGFTSTTGGYSAISTCNPSSKECTESDQWGGIITSWINTEIDPIKIEKPYSPPATECATENSELTCSGDLEKSILSKTTTCSQTLKIPVTIENVTKEQIKEVDTEKVDEEGNAIYETTIETSTKDVVKNIHCQIQRTETYFFQFDDTKHSTELNPIISGMGFTFTSDDVEYTNTVKYNLYGKLGVDTVHIDGKEYNSNELRPQCPYEIDSSGNKVYSDVCKNDADAENLCKKALRTAYENKEITPTNTALFTPDPNSETSEPANQPNSKWECKRVSNSFEEGEEIKTECNYNLPLAEINRQTAKVTYVSELVDDGISGGNNIFVPLTWKTSKYGIGNNQFKYVLSVDTLHYPSTDIPLNTYSSSFTYTCGVSTKQNFYEEDPPSEELIDYNFAYAPITTDPTSTFNNDFFNVTTFPETGVPINWQTYWGDAREIIISDINIAGRRQRIQDTYSNIEYELTLSPTLQDTIVKLNKSTHPDDSYASFNTIQKTGTSTTLNNATDAVTRTNANQFELGCGPENNDIEGCDSNIINKP
ncbi:MAG: hypothetical protein Q4G04_00365 [bacterium]|nr:hypothetical protein [bacterium]